MDKGKAIMMEEEEESGPRCVEAGSFMASIKGYVAQKLATTRCGREGPADQFDVYVPRLLRGLTHGLTLPP